jgi:hypothetical protein
MSVKRAMSNRVATTCVAAALLVGACGGVTPATAPTATVSPTSAASTGASPTATALPTPAPTADAANPVGMIAVGHSGLTGEGTGGPLQAVKANSWATGTNPEVNSIYLRLVEAVPATAMNVANTAAGGASAAMLASQIPAALNLVPVPLLAIIQTVDNDMVCGAANATDVGASVAKAIDMIHTTSPNTKVLIVGQFGRPSIDFVEELVAAVPAAKAELTWEDDCTFFTADGKINPAGFENLTATIDAYEAENARVCALVPNCYTDGGVRRTWVDELELFAADYAHLNVAGQAAEAQQMWPVVEEILGL